VMCTSAGVSVAAGATVPGTDSDWCNSCVCMNVGTDEGVLACTTQMCLPEPLPLTAAPTPDWRPTPPPTSFDGPVNTGECPLQAPAHQSSCEDVVEYGAGAGHTDLMCQYDLACCEPDPAWGPQGWDALDLDGRPRSPLCYNATDSMCQQFSGLGHVWVNQPFSMPCPFYGPRNTAACPVQPPAHKSPCSSVGEGGSLMCQFGLTCCDPNPAWGPDGWDAVDAEPLCFNTTDSLCQQFSGIGHIWVNLPFSLPCETWPRVPTPVPTPAPPTPPTPPPPPTVCADFAFVRRDHSLEWYRDTTWSRAYHLKDGRYACPRLPEGTVCPLAEYCCDSGTCFNTTYATCNGGGFDMAFSAERCTDATCPQAVPFSPRNRRAPCALNPDTECRYQHNVSCPGGGHLPFSQDVQCAADFTWRHSEAVTQTTCPPTPAPAPVPPYVPTCADFAGIRRDGDLMWAHNLARDGRYSCAGLTEGHVCPLARHCCESGRCFDTTFATCNADGRFDITYNTADSCSAGCPATSPSNWGMNWRRHGIKAPCGSPGLHCLYNISHCPVPNEHLVRFRGESACGADFTWGSSTGQSPCPAVPTPPPPPTLPPTPAPTHCSWDTCDTMTTCLGPQPSLICTSGGDPHVNMFSYHPDSREDRSVTALPLGPYILSQTLSTQGASAGFVVQACHKSSFSINTGVAVRSPYGTVKWVDGGPWVIECSTDTECGIECSTTTCAFPDGERVSMSGIRIWLSLPHSHCGHVEGLCGRYVSRLPADGACCCCGAPLPARCVRCSLHSSLTDPDSPALRCPCLHC
jgi:hypothetical protein